MSAPNAKTLRSCGGFTLLEISIGMGIGVAVIAGMLTLFTLYLRSYNTTSLMRTASSRACMTLERMVYGIGTNAGLREAQSLTFTYTSLTNGWQITYNTNLTFTYNSGTKKITDQAGKVIGTNIVASSVGYYTNSCLVSVTVAETAGGKIKSNTMQTLAQFRN